MAVPALWAVVNPFEPKISLTVATPVSDEVQVAHAVKSCCVLPASDNVPVAVNCRVVSGAMLGGFNGVTLIDATGYLVSVVDPVTLPEVALIMVEPELMAGVAVASPCEPNVLLMDAIPASDESQTTDVVRFRLLLFEKVPVAMNCRVVPGAMLELAGVTDNDTSVGEGPGSRSFTLQAGVITENSTATAMTTPVESLFFMAVVPACLFSRKD